MIRQNHDITNKYDKMTLHKTHVTYRCIHIHHSTVDLLKGKLKLEENWGQQTLIKATVPKGHVDLTL